MKITSPSGSTHRETWKVDRNGVAGVCVLMVIKLFKVIPGLLSSFCRNQIKNHLIEESGCMISTTTDVITFVLRKGQQRQFSSVE